MLESRVLLSVKNSSFLLMGTLPYNLCESVHLMVLHDGYLHFVFLSHFKH